MTTLLISDLHLQEKRPDITRAFLHFLQTDAVQAQALYILGDLFESWIGDDGMTTFQQQIAERMSALGQQGTQIYLMHGNRDFMLGRAFCEKARCTLLADPCRVEVAGETVLLMHGDTLCTRDHGYMRLRRWLRNPLSLFVLHHLPLVVRQKLAGALRKESRLQTSMKADEITDVTPEEVVRVMQHYNVRTLIHGHTHRPATHRLQVDGEKAQRIVLGDWDRSGWVLKADHEGLHQECFSL